MSAINAPVTPQINKPVTPGSQAAIVEKAPVIANTPPEPVIQAPTGLAEPIVKGKPGLTKDDVVPANWGIYPTDNDEIIFCKNSMTNKEFTGTHKQFSAFLRGE